MRDCDMTGLYVVIPEHLKKELLRQALQQGVSLQQFVIHHLTIATGKKQ